MCELPMLCLHITKPHHPSWLPFISLAPGCAGGSVLLYSGLIDKLDGDENGLAWVLAHEHSHLLGDHLAAQ